MLRGWVTLGVDVLCLMTVTAVGLGVVQVALLVVP